MEEKKTQAHDFGTASGYKYYCAPGNTIRERFVWNKEHDGLEKVGEVEIQKEIDEAARGMTVGEQIRRILRGDFSGISSGDPVYDDVSELPESMIDQMNVERAATNHLEETAQNYGITIDELKQQIADLEAKMEADKKAASETPKKEDAQ